MKKLLFAVLSVAFLCLMVSGANAEKNGQVKWALHFAGDHNSKANTCAFQVVDCLTQVNANGPCGPGRFDVYVLALDTDGIAGVRYGLCCDPPAGCFFFYGWTKCSDFEIATPGWPGCNEGNAQTWSLEKPAGNVTVGILDVYVYPGCSCCMSTCDDPRKGFAEVCDGSSPEPFCFTRIKASTPAAFGSLCFGVPGYNPCGVIGTEKSSWGAVKSLYR